MREGEDTCHLAFHARAAIRKNRRTPCKPLNSERLRTVEKIHAAPDLSENHDAYVFGQTHD